MKQVHDEKILERYINRYHINDIFNTPNFTFRLYQYERGEILNYRHGASNYLQFLVSGAVQIYSIHRDGSRYPLCLLNEFTLLGDMEFCGETSLPFLVEATKK